MATTGFQPEGSPFVPGDLAPAKNNLLRFTTAGSVDDGKSTLIGRLLYDSKAVYEDQIASIKKSRVNRSTGAVDFSLLTDGLRAEREQGITIDVAYRYFSTPKRKFIIADTPGHEQYTRNMATGASTADAAIVLIDATRGVLPQSRRHAYIASLLGIHHIVLAINKMDLVGYSSEIFRQIANEFEDVARKIGAAEVYAVPISALEGDNVVHRSLRMEWFEGATLLQHLEELPVLSIQSLHPVRFPVQYVIRPDQNFRGFAGTLAAGVLRRGDDVLALPSGHSSKVKSIVTYDGDANEAYPGDAVAVTLEDELDISRGDMLVAPSSPAAIASRFEARLVWMHPDSLATGRHYLLKHTTRTVRVQVSEIKHRININTFEHEAVHGLGMNEIGLVRIKSNLPLFVDPYSQLRTTGGFILIDLITNATVAAGTVERVLDEFVSPERTPAATKVSAEERKVRYGHGPVAVAVDDAQSAEALERALFDEHWNVIVVDAQAVGKDALGAVAQALQRSSAVVIFVGTDAPDLELVFGLDVFRGEVSSILASLYAWREQQLKERKQ